MSEPFLPDPSMLPILTDVVLPSEDDARNERLNHASFYVAFFENELRRERLLRNHNYHVSRRIAAPQEADWRVKYYFPAIKDEASAEVILSAHDALADKELVTAQFRRAAGHFKQKQNLKDAVKAIEKSLTPDQLNALLALNAADLQALLKK